MSIQPKVGQLFTISEVEDLLAEIERLRKALERTRPHVRNEIVEECAQRVDQMVRGTTTDYAVVLTAAAEVIRALKVEDKP